MIRPLYEAHKIHSVAGSNVIVKTAFSLPSRLWELLHSSRHILVNPRVCAILDLSGAGPWYAVLAASIKSTLAIFPMMAQPRHALSRFLH